jgi:hypothetical protein
MISKTHIREILGLSDAYDEGDIIEFKFDAPAHLRASSIPSAPGYGPLQTSAFVKFTGVLRPSDGVLYLFTETSCFINDSATNDILYTLNKNTLSGVYIETFVPQKIYVNSNTSSTEIEMASVIDKNVIGKHAIAVLEEGVKQPITKSIVFDKSVSYRPDDDKFNTKANWTNLGSYRGNYNRYKITFTNVDAMQYITNNPIYYGHFNRPKPTKPVIVQGSQVSRNVLQ